SRAGQEGRRRHLLNSLAGSAVDRCQARFAVVRHDEESVLHTQRLEHALAEEDVERLARSDFHDAPKDVERRAAAVSPLGSRLKIERDGPQARDGIGERVGRLSLLAYFGGLLGTGPAAGKSRSMRKEITDGDGPIRRDNFDFVTAALGDGDLGVL